MNIDLQVAMLGLFAALLGAWIGARVAYAYGREQAKLALTLSMFEKYQALLPFRIAADDLLSERISAEMSIDYATLYSTLPVDDWAKVSHVRHFWGNLALLHETEQLNRRLAKTLFAEDVEYWRSTYFREAERRTQPNSENWRRTWKTLESLTSDSDPAGWRTTVARLAGKHASKLESYKEGTRVA